MKLFLNDPLVTPSERAAAFDVNRIIGAAPSNLQSYARISIPLILAEAQAAGITDLGQIAYILATAQHESNLGLWMEELASGDAYEGRRDLGNTQPGDGRRYKGRGYVQITGRSNYTAWAQRLGIDLVNQPTRAAEPAIAAKIIVQGMRDGTFTGVGLGRYINGSNRDFVNARRIVNGTDRATLIAGYAENYLRVLLSGANTPTPPVQPATRRPYVVKAGDTLSGIALKQLGNASRWREISKDSAGQQFFTEAEARLLQIGRTVYLPVNQSAGGGNPIVVNPVQLPPSNPTTISNQIGRGSRAPQLFQQKYAKIGGVARGWQPINDARRWGNGWTQEFRASDGSKMLMMLEDGASAAYIVFGSNLDEYLRLGGAEGTTLDGRTIKLGYPRSDENGFTKDGKRAVWQAFAAEDGTARIHNLTGFASVATWGSIGRFYTNIGGANHWLGMPTRREYFDGDTVFSDFQGGRIAFNRNDGRTEALRLNEQPSWRQPATSVNSRITRALDSLLGIRQIRDPNGLYPGQCVSFVKRYTQLLGISMGAMGGNGGAKYGFINFNKPGLSLSAAQADKIVFTGSEQPRVGDIIFFDSTSRNMYGHIAVVQSIDGNGRITVEESNGDNKALTTGTSVTRRSMILNTASSGYGRVMGWLRLKL